MTYAPPYRLEGEQSDVIALADGHITVTPLHFDMTRHEQLDEVKSWDWPSPSPPDRG
jgi:5'-nucleotidase